MILAVQDLDFRVVYREGKANIADFLSRNAPPPDPNSEEEKLDLELSDDLEVAVVKKVRQQHNPITMTTIRSFTLNSPDLQFLIHTIRTNSYKQNKKRSKN